MSGSGVLKSLKIFSYCGMIFRTMKATMPTATGGKRQI